MPKINLKPIKVLKRKPTIYKAVRLSEHVVGCQPFVAIIGKDITIERKYVNGIIGITYSAPPPKGSAGDNKYTFLSADYDDVFVYTEDGQCFVLYKDAFDKLFVEQKK